MSKLWGGRFGAEPSPRMRALSSSTSFDFRLAPYDLRVLAAHVSMLAAAGILAAGQADEIRSALLHLDVVVDESDEDIHATIERQLGDLAASSRAGLSRNDRVVTAFRLWVMEHLGFVRTELIELVKALHRRAEEHRDTQMPGYTHLQRAQVVTLGLHLSAYALALLRDLDRLDAALDRCNALPLGSGALAGSTLSLDRSIAQKELGFARILVNTMDAVSSRDFALEVLAACAILGTTLSRLSEDVIVWTTTEFSFAELSDELATGSSLMPQKKNPDVAELTRGKTGRLIGNLTSLLATCKALPLAYNRDLQEDKEPVFDSIDTLLLVLPAVKEAIATIRFDTAAMAEAASDPFLLATDMAEDLVRDGIPFKRAHEDVGRAVREALETGKPLQANTTASQSAALRTSESIQESLGQIAGRLAAFEQVSSIGNAATKRSSS